MHIDTLRGFPFKACGRVGAEALAAVDALEADLRASEAELDALKANIRERDERPRRLLLCAEAAEERARKAEERARKAEALLRQIANDYHCVVAEPDPDAGQHLDGCVGCFARAALEKESRGRHAEAWAQAQAKWNEAQEAGRVTGWEWQGLP
jgi:hypothetical protein